MGAGWLAGWAGGRVFPLSLMWPRSRGSDLMIFDGVAWKPTLKLCAASRV